MTPWLTSTDFTVGLLGTYLAAAEYISAQKSKGEVLIFQRGHKKSKKHRSVDPEAGELATRTVSVPKDVSMIPRQTSIFQWEDV